MLNRKSFLQLSSLGLGSLYFSKLNAAARSGGFKPIVISTWAEGINANNQAYHYIQVYDRQ